ncbi:MAG: transglutaminase domain-containing protein [Planctomycetota bacterium]|jgi:transglutaminase-like putative cysteine protease|nr:transglutaminase domain-containing protein [Planctomycetota bacterium]
MAAVFSPAAGGGEHPWNDKRIYYVVEQEGRLREKGYFIRRTGSWRRAPCVVTEEDKFYFQDGETLTPARSVKIRVISTPGGEAIQRHEEVVIGDPGRESIFIENGEALFNCSGAYGESSRAPAPPGAVFEVSGEWLASRRLVSGESFEAGIVERRGRRVRGESVTIREQLAPGGGGQPAIWLAEFNSPGRSPMFARFTSDGRLIRLETGRLIHQVVGREDFELGRIPSSPVRPESDPAPASAPSSGSQGAIAVGMSVPAWDNFAWLILRAGPQGRWDGIIQPSEYSRIDYFGADAALVLTRHAPRVDPDASLPLRVPAELGAYLSAYPGLPVLYPGVLEAARSALADVDSRREESNALKAVSFLAGWVHQNIALLSPGGDSSVELALTGRSADAAGQARLFASMARAVGIPSRLCQGFLSRTGLAEWHCWAEVWINGVWMPVDATVNRVGLPAGYALAERSGPDGAFGRDFAGFLLTPGLTLSLASAGRETPSGGAAELVAGDRRTYARAEGDWLANLYWGFALRLPPDWIGSARLDSVEAESPDGEGRLKCEALAGDFGTGPEDLDAFVSGLRSGLRRFRVIESRVLHFDAAGSTPALFADFTSREGNAALRCRQYLLPRRRRAFRVSFWAPAGRFDEFSPYFDSILASLEY